MTATLRITEHDVWSWLVDGSFEIRVAQLSDDTDAREICERLCKEVSARLSCLNMMLDSIPVSGSDLSIAIALALRVPVADRWAVSLMLDGRGDEVEARVWREIEPQQAAASP